MKNILKELKEHAPFTIFAVIAAVLVVVFIQYFLKKEIGEGVFHFFHFSHVVLSAVTTSAIYYKYRKKISGTFLIGVVGALAIGSLSDVIFPYLGGLLLDNHIHFHLPLIEKTFHVFLFAVIGSFIGIVLKTTKIPHFAHVFLSVFASLFYLLAFTTTFAPIYFLASVVIVFVAVIIPCCLSDIVFPLIFVKNKKL